MSDSRTPQLLHLRPPVPVVLSDGMSEAERFQNTTLRPILKFQNDLLVAVFRQYIRQHKNVFASLSRAKKEAYIDHALRQDIPFRNGLIGTIVGHFTTEEYGRYLEQENELRRRIVDLLARRLKDQILNTGY
ncbi:MAG: hypothetical protein KDC43_18275 [Saprospiraceae bacterium]|nr:hypothetical protein [Saprospiraceae bacterium]